MTGLDVQVLGKFFKVVAKRIPGPLSIENAEKVIHRTGIHCTMRFCLSGSS